MNLKRIEQLTELFEILSDKHNQVTGAINITFCQVEYTDDDKTVRTHKFSDDFQQILKSATNQALTNKLKSLDLKKETLKQIRIMIKDELFKEQSILAKARKLLKGLK